MWLAALLLLGALGKTFDVTPILLNVSLLHAWYPSFDVAFSVNSTTWTLSCEMAFYLAFPLLHRALTRLTPQRQWITAVGAVVVAEIAVGILVRIGLTSVGYTNPLIRSAEFVVGIVLALEVQRGWRPKFGFRQVGVGILACIAITEYTLPDVWLGTYVMLWPLTVVLAVAATSRGSVVRFLGTPWSVYLGELSFAFYLVHWLVLKEVLALGADLPGAVALGITFAGSFAAAAVLHHLVERPAQTFLLGMAARVHARA